jgi:RNA polymerase sigma factor (TIGR02999 family)
VNPAMAACRGIQGVSITTASREMDAAARDVTRLLAVARHGDPDAFNHLMPLVYAELRQIARRQLRRLRPGDTLGTTGLVHEAYIKLIDQKRASWQDRNHFFSIAARAMRQILVNHAIQQQALKRGSGQRATVALEDEQIPAAEPEAQLIALDAALDRLERIDARLSGVVECRFFGGLTEEEAAATLGVSLRTVQRDWKLARAWLQEELDGTD